MKHHQVCRLATHPEQELLARYLIREELGKHPIPSDQEAVEQAVDEASITIFPSYYPNGSHQVWVIWSEQYPQLPNHPEHFKISKDGSRVERIYVYTRHKYYRINQKSTMILPLGRHIGSSLPKLLRTIKRK